MQHVLHFEVVERVGAPELDVSVSLVAGKARGVEGDEAVAHGPVLDGGMQDARVSENDDLRGIHYQGKSHQDARYYMSDRSDHCTDQTTVQIRSLHITRRSSSHRRASSAQFFMSIILQSEVNSSGVCVTGPGLCLRTRIVL